MIKKTFRILQHILGSLVVTSAIVLLAFIFLTPIRPHLWTSKNEELNVVLHSSSPTELNNAYEAFMSTKFSANHYYQLTTTIPNTKITFDMVADGWQDSASILSGQQLTDLQNKLRAIKDTNATADWIQRALPDELLYELDYANAKGRPCTLSIRKVGKRFVFQHGDKQVVVIIRDTLTINEPSNAWVIIVPTGKIPGKRKGRSIETYHPILSSPSNAYSFIPAKNDSIMCLMVDQESFALCEWIIHPTKEGSQAVFLRLDRRINGKSSVVDGRIEIIPVHIQEATWSFTKEDVIAIVSSTITLVGWIISLYFKRKDALKKAEMMLDDPA